MTTNKYESKLDQVGKLCKDLRLSQVMEEIAALSEDPDALESAQIDWFLQSLGREKAKRQSNSLERRTRAANLRHPQANQTNIIYEKSRGLSRRRIEALMTCNWVQVHQNCLIVGKVGVGKTWLACALGNACCRAGLSVKMIRVPELIQDLQFAVDVKKNPLALKKQLMRYDLLILDDWGIGQVGSTFRLFLGELADARHGRASTLLTSVLPIGAWAEWIGDATMADGILDRLLCGANIIEITGESMRRRTGNVTDGRIRKLNDTHAEQPAQGLFEQQNLTTRQKVHRIMQDCLDNHKPLPSLQETFELVGRRGSWGTITSAKKEWLISHHLWNPPAYTQK